MYLSHLSAKAVFFEGTLPSIGDVRKANHNLHISKTTQRQRHGKAKVDQPDKSQIVAISIINIHSTSSKFITDWHTQSHSSWWQTSSICTQLGYSHQRYLCLQNSEGMPFNTQLLVQMQLNLTLDTKEAEALAEENLTWKKKSSISCQQVSNAHSQSYLCS